TLSAALNVDTVVTYSTVDGSAVAGADFTGATNATITIPAFATTGTISIPVLNDTIVEGAEQFSVLLSSAQNVGGTGSLVITNTTGTATILDNDTETFSLTQASTSVTEGSADTYTIHLSNPIGAGVTVSVNLDITLPLGLGGAEAADFTNSFQTDIDNAINALGATAGVTRSGSTLLFTSSFTTSPPLTFSPPPLH